METGAVRLLYGCFFKHSMPTNWHSVFEVLVISVFRGLSVHFSERFFQADHRFFDDLCLELIFSGLNPLEKAEFLSKTLSTLDENERHLLTAYFENDMSLSGTSRQLFIHKNTLQYKLNHIFRKSGLNPRAFKDAVMLYLGLNLAK